MEFCMDADSWVVHYSDIVWTHDIDIALDSMVNNL